MLKKYSHCLILLLVGLNGLTAQSDFATLKEFIQSLQEQSPLQKTNFSISLRDEQGLTLLEHNADIRLMPASTLKLVTTVSAIKLLGADFRYHTDFYIKGTLANGVLKGDLIIVPSWDPSFGSPRDPSAVGPDSLVQNLILLLHAKGISSITGNLVVVNRQEDGINVHPSWPWDDLANYYAAGTYPFNFHENYFDYIFSRSKKEGELAGFDSMDAHAPVSVQSMVTIGPKGSSDNAYFYGAPDSRTLTIKGTIPPGTLPFKIRGAVPFPHEHFAKFLGAKAGWPSFSPKIVTSYALDSALFIYRHFSEPLIKLAQYANDVSNNLYCDAILKSLASQNKNPGFDGGVKTIADFWQNNGLNEDDLTQVDGSGLSMQNRITATGMTEFLSKMVLGDNDITWKSVIPSLENNSYFMVSEKRRTRCWLKSGSFRSVLCYAGVIEDRHGKCYSIVLMCNGHTSTNRTIRAIYERIISKIFDTIDQETN